MSEIIDCGIFYDDEMEQETNQQSLVSIPDALVMSINQYGNINFRYMETITGESTKNIIAQLSGNGIWQDPVLYAMNPKSEIGWMLGEQYFSGNLVKKLRDAQECNKVFPGRFSANIKELKARLPLMPELDDIFISLGSSWIPAEFYSRFIEQLLDPYYAPEVHYIEYLGKWKLNVFISSTSVKNNFVYGTHRMSGINIIEHTMNAKQIKITDCVEQSDGKKKYVLNKVETLAAQEKQRLIIEEFDKWIRSDNKALEQLQTIYSEQYGYTIGQFNGDFLELPGINPDIILYAHQRNAVARIVLSQNVLLAHDVGAGKTYEMVVGAHELKRMGLSSKNLLVIPNNVLDAVASAHRLLYPEDEILVIYPKDFTPSKREEVLNRIKYKNYTAIYMSYSSFDMIKTSPKYKIRKLQKEIHKCQAQINASTNIRVKTSLRSERERLQKKLVKLIEKVSDPKQAECFEKLGVTALFVDEAHNYKNISLEVTIGDHVIGMNAKGSAKSDEMLEKIDCVHSQGGRVIFATGTPLTNSLADLYVLQRYLQPAELSVCGIDRFPQWLNTFVQRETSFEMDVDAHNFRMKTRFSRFHNLPELMAMFSSICDFYHASPGELELPEFEGYTDIQVKRSAKQIAYMDKLVKRTEKIRHRKVDRAKDNLLKVTVDGRKCALDIRLVEPDLKHTPEVGKLISCRNEIMKLVRQYPEYAQLVFCDISTPKQGFNVYDTLKQLLINDGMAESEIAFVHEGSTDKKKQELFRKVNSGQIKVMIGSTQKLGTGVNVQERLIAIHHLDIPWRPADMVQREGRLIRNGNLCPEVFIYRYVTESSFDAYTYQILESKQKFISSFLSGSMNVVHRCEKELDDLVLDYAEIKALAIGNPKIKRRVELSNEIERLKIERRQKQTQLLGLQKVIADFPLKRKKMQDNIKSLENDYAYYCINKKTLDRDEQQTLGETIVQNLAEGIMLEKPIQIGMIHGFKIVIPSYMKPEKPGVQLQRGNGLVYFVKMKDAKIMGCCRRLENALEALMKKRKEMEGRLQDLESEKVSAEKEIGKGNPFDLVIAEKYRELEVIDNELKNA